MRSPPRAWCARVGGRSMTKERTRRVLHRTFTSIERAELLGGGSVGRARRRELKGPPSCRPQRSQAIGRFKPNRPVRSARVLTRLQKDALISTLPAGIAIGTFVSSKFNPDRSRHRHVGTDGFEPRVPAPVGTAPAKDPSILAGWRINRNTWRGPTTCTSSTALAPRCVRRQATTYGGTLT